MSKGRLGDEIGSPSFSQNRVRTGSMSIILSDEKLQDGLEQVSDTIEFTRFSRQVTLMVSRDYPGENNGEGP